MRLLLITCFALLAFAANSVLTRAALAGGEIGPGTFTAVRLLSGAVVLALLASAAGRNPLAAGSWISAFSLFAYAAAFSAAYLTLDAGIGALILFALVQITMFVGSLLVGERPGAGRWIGSVLGLTGLAVLFLPGAGVPDPFGAALMVLAGIAWGVYSLRGKSAGDPLAATAGNFLRAVPPGLIIWILAGDTGGSFMGYALAITSGGLASGIGYAIWYSALPRLDASLAAIAQLTVPLIALGGGIVFLDEAATPAFLLAACLILGGVVLAVFWPAKR